MTARRSAIASGCINVAVAVSLDQRRVYVLDKHTNTIRVLEQKR